MAKKARTPKAGRVNTHSPKGSTSTEAAPANAQTSADLGPMVLPDGEGAIIVLRELGTLAERGYAAFQRYETLKHHTAAAKADYDDIAAQIQQRIRESTHPSEKPLLSVAEREADLEAMKAGGAVAETEAPASQAPASEAIDAPAAEQAGETSVGF